MVAFLLQEECNVLSNDKARWREAHCSQRPASQSTVQHTLRPCCKGDGQCSLTSPEHCWFMKGRFHFHVEHCTQVLKAHFQSDNLIVYRAINRKEKVILHVYNSRTREYRRFEQNLMAKHPAAVVIVNSGRYFRVCS